jgi:hypothetical protein
MAWAVALGACDDATAPGGAASLPSSVHLRATATQRFPDGDSVDCSFDLIVTLTSSQVPAPNTRVYAGTMGGSASRTVLAADGSGLSFFADMAWPQAAARVFGPDSVEFVLSAPAPDSRFWDAFKLVAGTKDPRGHWSGLWTCYPLDINSGGYLDTSLVAAGSWEMVTDPGSIRGDR